MVVLEQEGPIFIRQYLKLYQDQDGEAWAETHQYQNQDNKNIILV